MDKVKKQLSTFRKILFNFKKWQKLSIFFHKQTFISTIQKRLSTNVRFMQPIYNRIFLWILWKTLLFALNLEQKI